MKLTSRSLTLLLCLCSVLLTLRPAYAASISVTTTTDENNTNPDACSLREAVEAADTDTAYGGCPAGSGADMITVPAGTYQLTLGSQLQIDSTLTISGAGAGSTFIQAGAAENTVTYGVFSITAAGNATFSAVTIRYGGSYLPQTGGGISNLGTLALTNGTEVAYNRVVIWGGGIYHGGAALTIDSTSSVHHNRAPFGGGIYIESGTNSIAGSVTDNIGYGSFGGGIMSRGGTTTITGTVSNNGSSNAAGIYNDTTGVVTLNGATVQANRATYTGAGVYQAGGGSMTIINSSITDNVAVNSDGGGVYYQGGTLSITGTTISGNSAAGSGGGVYSITAGASITGSHILFNTATGDGDAVYASADLSATDSCIVGNDSVAVFSSGANTITATDDWWGMAEGPGSIGPSAAGDTISTNVTYTGWKTTAPSGCPVCLAVSGVGGARTCN